MCERKPTNHQPVLTGLDEGSDAADAADAGDAGDAAGAGVNTGAKTAGVLTVGFGLAGAAGAVASGGVVGAPNSVGTALVA